MRFSLSFFLLQSIDACRVVDVLPGVGRAILVNAKDPKRVKEKLYDVLSFANRTVGLDPEVVCSFTDPERMFAAFVHDSGKIVSVIGAEPCLLVSDPIRFVIEKADCFFQ